MATPFSNTKVRLPEGFQSLLVGLSTEILRNQPRNIPEFAAQYFERLLQRREQGEPNSSDRSTAHADRNQSNQTFQEDFPANDPGVHNAATKIQAQFRGYKVRRELDKMKEESDEISDSNQHQSNYDHEQSRTINDEYQKSSAARTGSSQSQDNKSGEQGKLGEEQLTEEEKREQERAAISIQAQFRGYQTRKNLRESSDHSTEQEEQEQHNNGRKPSSHLNDRGENPNVREETKADENAQDHRPLLEREPTQLSDDFAKQRRTSSNFDLGQHDASDNDEMSDSNLDKAATRIQASYRGYKIRKELGTGPGVPLTGNEQDHSSSSSSQAHDEFDNARNKNILSPSAEGNKEPVGEEDDNAAAVRIQAAYRGYRVRKDLEK